MEKAILNVKLKDKIKINIIKKKLRDNLDVILVAKRKKWDWVGHVTRLKDDRCTYKITKWCLKGGWRRGR